MRGVRRTAAAVTLALAAATAAIAGPGTASAAEPIVVGDCSTTVRGEPGQPVTLRTSAVLGVVVDAVRAVPVLGPPLAGSVHDTVAKLPPIPIGSVPSVPGRSSTISGAKIADAVVAKLRELPLLGPVLSQVVNSVRGTLTNLCGITVTSVNSVAAPVQDGTDAVADTSERVFGGSGGNPGGGDPGTGEPSPPGSGGPSGGGPAPEVIGGVPGLPTPLYPNGWDFGRAPMTDYSTIPFARPGMYAAPPGVRYGGSVPGYTPEFGILGEDGDADGVSTAGHAEALPSSGDRIALPVLLAVFALAGVTAALVRTWVLRKASA